MKRLVVVTALAFVLAAMPSVPQRAYACGTPACATDDSTATQVPAATDQTGKSRTACTSAGCARPDNASEPPNSAAKGDRLDRGVQQACPTQNCARPDEDKTRSWRAPAPTARPLSPHLLRSLAPTPPARRPKATTRREQEPA